MIKKNLANICLEMCAEIARKNDDYKYFYEQFGKLISLALSGKSVNFSKIISMIDEMVTLRERVPERIADEIIDVFVPQVMEETVDAAKHIPQEQVQSYTVEQIIDVLVPQIRKGI